MLYVKIDIVLSKKVEVQSGNIHIIFLFLKNHLRRQLIYGSKKDQTGRS